MVFTTSSGYRSPQGNRWEFNLRVSQVTEQGDHVVTDLQRVDRIVSCTATDAPTPLVARPNTRSATGVEDFPGDVFVATLSGTTDAYLTVVGR